MKRIISIILSVTMLMSLLCITASADDINSIWVTFDPQVNENIHSGVDVALNQVPANRPCSIICKLTGNGITAFKNARIDSLSDITDICTANPFPSDMTTYKNQEYLFVFSYWLDGDAASTPLSISASNGMSGNYLFEENSLLYFYFTFTPKAAEGNNNNTNTNAGSGNNGTTNGSPATLDCPSSYDIDVNATYNAADDATEIYSVVITWGSMNFTYNAESTGTWDPDTHTYKYKTPASWTYSEGANLITVTNHSNTAINANFSFLAMENFNNVNGEFSRDNTNETVFTDAQAIRTAVGTTYTSAPFVSAYLMLSGDLPEATTGSVKCGVVTVTIS